MSRESPQHSSFPRPTSQYRDDYNQNNAPHRSPTSPQGQGQGYGYSDQPRTASSSYYQSQRQSQYQSQYHDQDRRNNDYNEEHYDNPFSNPPANQRGRDYDDDTPDGGAGGGGGYTDDQFNVAMDFNNAGPRYAEVYGGQRGEDMAQLAAGARPVSMYRNSSFNPLEPQPSHLTQTHADDRSLHSTSKSTKGGPGRKPLLENMDSYAAGGPYGHGAGLGNKEGGSVAGGYGNGGLGGEVGRGGRGMRWSWLRFLLWAQKLHSMTKRHRQSLRRDKRSRAWKEWSRDQRGCCGVGWMTRRLLVVGLFFFCIALGITLYFVIPRAPTFTFPSEGVFSVDNSTIGFSRSPANFSYNGNINMLADSTNSYLPVHFTSLDMTVYNLDTNKIIGTGQVKGLKMNKGPMEQVSVPVEFSYSAVNSSDTTWSDMYNACGHIWAGTVRSSLSFRVSLTMNIRGLVTKQGISRPVTDLTCPFELSGNSV